MRVRGNLSYSTNRVPFYLNRRINLPKRSREIELDYMDHIREIMRESIKKQRVDRVAEILSHDKIIIKNSKTSLVQNNYLYILDRPKQSKTAFNGTNSFFTSNNESYFNSKRKATQASLSSISLKSSDSVKKVKKFKSIRMINWSKFYLDEHKRDNALHYAARLGKTFLIDVLIKSNHFDINQPNHLELDSALTLACDSGHLDTVWSLIKYGADVNQENARGKTPLILATELKDPHDIDLCRVLLNYGALVNQVTRDMNTGLLRFDYILYYFLKNSIKGEVNSFVIY
jgi:hypothetical protein